LNLASREEKSMPSQWSGKEGARKDVMKGEGRERPPRIRSYTAEEFDLEAESAACFSLLSSVALALV